ncbi:MULTISPECIES: thioredoxin family protein [unclassified Paenibacillus]|uniref:thioredoxin family protein n=1 Tax=unclassified Paenibacillus TaxID=185978 RepID=UPI003626236A
MRKIKSISEYREAIGNDKPTVAVFKTEWCKDCHYINPFMPELEINYGERLDFIEIDRDELPELCEENNVLGIPSFILFYRSKEQGRFVSKLRKTREEIELFLDEALANCKREEPKL